MASRRVMAAAQVATKRKDQKDTHGAINRDGIIVRIRQPRPQRDLLYGARTDPPTACVGTSAYAVGLPGLHLQRCGMSFVVRLADFSKANLSRSWTSSYRGSAVIPLISSTMLLSATTARALASAQRNSLGDSSPRRSSSSRICRAATPRASGTVNARIMPSSILGLYEP
jgi:hypothetical protein